MSSEVKQIQRLTFTTDEAAVALGLSTKTVRNLIASNELPRVRVGRRIMIPCRALEDWLLKQTFTPEVVG